MEVDSRIPGGVETVHMDLSCCAVYDNRLGRKEKKRPLTQPLTDVERTLTVTNRLRDERSELLYQQIGQLEPIDRSVCLLLLDGFSYKEMVEMLGISESNVGVKVHRIKQYLIEKSKEVMQYEL